MGRSGDDDDGDDDDDDGDDDDVSGDEETTRETRASSPSLVSAQTTDARFLVRFDAYANVSAHETTTTGAEATRTERERRLARGVARRRRRRSADGFVVVERVGARRRSRSGTCATTKSGPAKVGGRRLTMRGVAGTSEDRGLRK